MASVFSPDGRPAGDLLPAEAPLVMPPQDFRASPRRPAWGGVTEADLWQGAQFGLAGAMTLFGATCAESAFQSGGVTLLETADLTLFTILFGWIAFALASALIGFGVAIGGAVRSPRAAAAAGDSGLAGRRSARFTAILMPVHNEDPDLVCRRLRNMNRSLRALGAEAPFHIFMLSDTRDLEILRRERAAISELRRLEGAEDRIFHRWRVENIGRKAGNIAEWVRRFGGSYDYMIVLDADSVLEGATLVRLVELMDQEPKTGLIQTVPQLVNRLSLFGRLQQFASRLYGPMLSEGLAQTSGGAGNYFGHNAIIRVRAFADHAGLPPLRGFGPWSGDILSHDFVEAALLRRAGWEVRLAPELAGSFEECPPSLSDLIVRDRRWCRGNLQHVPLIWARGLHWVSRVHLAKGVLTYLMPPVWLMFLILGAVRSSLASGPGGEALDDYALDTVAWLLSLSLLSLFLPRALSIFRALARSEERRLWGDPLRLILGVAIEVALSALISPILMTAQTLGLIGVLAGRHSGWSAQQRADGALAWSEGARRYWPHTILGLLVGVLSAGLGGAAALWLAPVVVGLILAIPIAVLSSDPRLGARIKALGLLQTPEERAPPRILEGLAPPAPVFGRPDLRRSLDALFADRPAAAER